MNQGGTAALLRCGLLMLILAPAQAMAQTTYACVSSFFLSCAVGRDCWQGIPQYPMWSITPGRDVVKKDCPTCREDRRILQGMSPRNFKRMLQTPALFGTATVLFEDSYKYEQFVVTDGKPGDTVHYMWRRSEMNRPDALDISTGTCTIAASSAVTPYTAQSGPLTLMNCSGKSIEVKTYNQGDALLSIPFETKTIANGSRAALKCNTSTCRVHIGGRFTTEAMSGYHVFLDNVYATNLDAMKRGCVAYQKVR